MDRDLLIQTVQALAMARALIMTLDSRRQLWRRRHDQDQFVATVNSIDDVLIKANSILGDECFCQAMRILRETYLSRTNSSGPRR